MKITTEFKQTAPGVNFNSANLTQKDQFQVCGIASHREALSACLPSIRYFPSFSSGDVLQV